MSRNLHDNHSAADRPAASAAGLLADDRGAVLVWTVFIALPVFFALGAVAVDAHRTFNTFDEAQSFADHTALAAARELNGRVGAIDRAIEAACGPGPENRPLVNASHTYGREVGGARSLNVGQLRFLSALGPDPSAPNQHAPAVGDIPICTATCGAPAPCLGLSATLNASARFVEVTTQPVPVDWLLWPVMQAFGVATLNSADAAARATAGQNAGVCNVPPLWMCNPLQTAGASLNDPQYIGMQIKAKAQGGGNQQYAPGNFGLLNAFNGNGASELREAAASLNPTDQCTGYSVDFKTGSVTGPVEQGFNIRFDMYDGPMSGNKNNPLYPPAQNVTKGLVTSGGACKTTQSTQTMPIPRDTCFTDFDACSGGNKTTGTCSNLGGDRFGDGNWDCAGYWQKNHTKNGITPPMPPGCANPKANRFTRWDLYQYEIDNNLIPDKSAIGSENGNPTCSSQSWTPPPGQPDRRELIIAVVDCLDANGNGLYNGAETNVPVREYIRAFLTEPIGVCNSSDKDVFIEYLGPADPEALRAVFRDYPVLYR